MQIISHRGYWKTPNEKNCRIAFQRSFGLELGTETDIRDYLGEIVISHDIADATAITLQDLFTIYNQSDKKPTLALNIKSDGLQKKIKIALQQFGIKNYFVFDMSIPDTLGYIAEGIDFFSRQSEFEPKPVFYRECKGVWLDAFMGDWYDTQIIIDHLRNKKKVAIVSSDLHKRDAMPMWERLKRDEIHRMEGVVLCTDIPEDALNFFNLIYEN
jgi:hypothetical protein